MKKEIEIVIKPENRYNKEHLLIKSAAELKMDKDEINTVVIERVSLDSRCKDPVLRIRVQVFIDESPVTESFYPCFKNVSHDKQIHIIGFGPSGIFAAIRALEIGIKPIIYERGSKIPERSLDIARLRSCGEFNNESNYCFGEGGAGAYSDGKLFSRSKKKGHNRKILDYLVFYGADDSITVEAKPHIGSDLLPHIVQKIREDLLKHGAEIHFQTKLTDINIKGHKLESIVLDCKEEIAVKNLILATGHSARDVFALLKENRIKTVFKPFALGLRIEHPEELINKIQYGNAVQEQLPSAEYMLSCQIDGKGVYSFCMCPGGEIIPAMSSDNELVLNGMSGSKRDGNYSSAGIVTQITEDDLADYEGFASFKGLEFQKYIEGRAYSVSDGALSAPADNLLNFILDTEKYNLGGSSYTNGLIRTEMAQIFPRKIADRLKKGIKTFSEKKRGFLSEEAMILAPETRTSSPLRILRDKEKLNAEGVEGIYPCGEGSGYAGGIISSAVDGIRVVDAIAAGM